PSSGPVASVESAAVVAGGSVAAVDVPVSSVPVVEPEPQAASSRRSARTSAPLIPTVLRVPLFTMIPPGLFGALSATSTIPCTCAVSALHRRPPPNPSHDTSLPRADLISPTRRRRLRLAGAPGGRRGSPAPGGRGRRWRDGWRSGSPARSGSGSAPPPLSPRTAPRG